MKSSRQHIDSTPVGDAHEASKTALLVDHHRGLHQPSQSTYSVLSIMKISIILSVLGFTAIALSANCQCMPGPTNGACVKLCGESNYSSAPTISRPTCVGNCYSYPFDNIKVSGDGVYGTNCQAFTDANCNVFDGETGYARDSACYSIPGARSIKCFYHC